VSPSGKQIYVNLPQLIALAHDNNAQSFLVCENHDVVNNVNTINVLGSPELVCLNLNHLELQVLLPLALNGALIVRFAP
jgi:hypothetical protein